MINKWVKRYLKLAIDVSKWTTCLSREVGCVITVKNRIVATGYNGAPSGVESCLDIGYCLREKCHSGEMLDMCMATHAEQNALTQAAKLGISIDDGDAYITTQPCTTCTKLLINSGIKRVFYIDSYPNDLSLKIAKEAGLELIQVDRNQLED